MGEAVTNLVEPLSGADAARLAGSIRLVALDREFPDWVFRRQDQRVMALSVDLVPDRVMPILVNAVSEDPESELLYLGVCDVIPTGTSQDDSTWLNSFRVRPGAAWEDVQSMLCGRAPGAGTFEGSEIGSADFVVVSAWCEVVGFMPDHAFVAFHDDAPASLVAELLTLGVDIEGLLAQVGQAWPLRRKRGPVPKPTLVREGGLVYWVTRTPPPTDEELAAGVPWRLRRKIRRNWAQALARR